MYQSPVSVHSSPSPSANNSAPLVAVSPLVGACASPFVGARAPSFVGVPVPSFFGVPIPSNISSVHKRKRKSSTQIRKRRKRNSRHNNIISGEDYDKQMDMAIFGDTSDTDSNNSHD